MRATPFDERAQPVLEIDLGLEADLLAGRAVEPMRLRTNVTPSGRYWIPTSAPVMRSRISASSRIEVRMPVPTL